MEALASPTCPTSFQLQWGLRCRQPSPRLVRVRSCAHGRRSWSGVVRSAGSEGSAEDSFSGWFREDSDGNNGKKDYGGFVGVGLAGIFLAAGVMFASLSFSGKRPTGVKQQMEPLTSQEEQLLSTDYQNENGGTFEEKGDVIPSNGVTKGITSGVHEDHISSLRTAESAASDSKFDDCTPEFLSVLENEIPTNVSDNISNKDLVPDANSSLCCTPGSNKSESLVLGLEDAYDIKDHGSNMTSSNEGIGVEKHEYSSDMNSTDLLSNGSNLANLNTSLQEEHVLPSEKGYYKSSAEVGGPLTNEPLDFNSSLNLDANTTVDTQTGTKDTSEVKEYFPQVQGVEFEANTTVDTQNGKKDTSEVKEYFPQVQGVEFGEKLQPLNEEHQSENNVSGNIPSGTNSISTLQPKEELVVKGTFSSALEQSSLGENQFHEPPSHSALISQYSDETQLYKHVETSGDQSSKSVPHNNYFSHAGIPAPSIVCTALQVPLGKVLVPAVVDQVQTQAFTALQVLKVIEGDVVPSDICTRREYARWLVSTSGVLSRNTSLKVYPAMYIENVTELAFDDVTPEDPDFPNIQGLAEAGLISSKLSRSDVDDVKGEELGTMLFFPERPLSRQDLVSWKMALERRQLAEVDKKAFHQSSGYIDIDKINPDAWPAIVADLNSGESGIISLAFGYTRLFQPEKPVTKAQAAVALSIGDASEVVGEELTRIEAESMAETAVAAHTALVAEVEKELNASFEKELSIEREKIDAIEKLAEEAKSELKKLRKERDEENSSLIKERAAVESEMEVLSRLRNDVEEQLEHLIGNKTEIAFERERVNKLRMEAEKENQVIVQLQYELEVERKALAMARTWAENEARRAREQARALEEARERWERHGIKVIVDEELQETASDGVAFLGAGEQASSKLVATSPETFVERLRSRSHNLVEEFKVRAENLVEKLKLLSAKVRGKSAVVIQQIIQKVLAVVTAMKQRFSDASGKVTETYSILASRTSKSMQETRDGASAFGSGVRDAARRAADDCKEGMEKITHKFKA